MLGQKKGQISANVFIYLFSVIVIAIILTMGYNYISSTKETISKTELILLKNKLTSDIKSISQDYGSFKKVSYSIPPLTELCLVDLNEDKKDKILGSELINFYPLVKDSINSNVQKNAFVFGQGVFESYFIGNIAIDQFPHFICLRSTAGKIEFGIEGTGKEALIII